MQKKKRKKKSNKKSNNLLYILILVLVLAAGGFTYFKFFKTSSGSGNTNATVQSNNDYVVSTSNETATKIGEEVLAKGGNAVDAAIAVSYALGVAQPYASGIGGGGGMLIYNPSSTDYKFYDYKDAAPVSATTKQSDTAVPGFVLGMEKISNDLGTMDISDLIQYSVDLARDGVEVNSDTVKAINSFASLLQNDEDYVKEDGSLLSAGDKLVQSELANTLKTIQEKGSAGFYSGEIGQNIANAAKMQLSDLSAYEVKEEKPVEGDFNGYKVVSAPAPFSGTTLIQMLKIIEKEGETSDLTDTAQYLQALDKATTLAHYSRGKKLADPAFRKVNEQNLVTDEYIQKLIDSHATSYSQDDESESTTHFVIVDKDGMVVSATNTLGHFYGSQDKVNGFYLNCSLKSFGTSGKNKYEAGKRPRTYTSPTIIQKDDYIMGIGTPGGVRILKMLAPIIVDDLYFGKDLQSSINKSRVIFYEPGVLMLEDGRSEEYIIDVSNCGYPYVDVKDQLYFGAVQAGGISNGKYFGASDNRRLGKVSINDK